MANWREGTISKLARNGDELGRFDAGQLPFESTSPGLGPLPFDIMVQGEDVWVANSGFGTLARFTREGELLGSYPVGAAPAGLAWDGEAVWVSNTSDDTVVRLKLPGVEN